MIMAIRMVTLMKWFFLLQVIGTPVEADWPEESSVLRSNFSYARGRGVNGILAELDPQV